MVLVRFYMRFPENVPRVKKSGVEYGNLVVRCSLKYRLSFTGAVYVRDTLYGVRTVNCTTVSTATVPYGTTVVLSAPFHPTFFHRSCHAQVITQNIENMTLDPSLTKLIAGITYLIPFLGICVFIFLRKHRAQKWTGTRDEFAKEFLKLLATDTFWGGNQEIKLVLTKLLSACQKGQSVVISCENKFQMLQFVGDADKMFVRFKGQPMLTLERWGTSSSKDKALTFLRKSKKEEQVDMISCSTEDIFRAIFEHLAATCRSAGDVDAMSGARIYLGYVSPKKV